MLIRRCFFSPSNHQIRSRYELICADWSKKLDKCVRQTTSLNSYRYSDFNTNDNTDVVIGLIIITIHTRFLGHP